MMFKVMWLILSISGTWIAVFGYGYILHIRHNIPYTEATEVGSIGIILGLILMLFIVESFFRIKTHEFKQRRVNESRQKAYSRTD